MEIIAVILIAALLVFLLKNKTKKPKAYGPIPESWKAYLKKKVEFYCELDPDEQILFENRLQYFLHSIRISGVDTDVNENDCLLVAASAIIPVFAFPEWQYPSLREVLLYPASFNEQFKTGQEDSLITGMVGTGYMEGKMILSKPALHYGFSNSNDKKNVGIHEFVHLIDKADGVIDGIPEALVNKEFAIPWLELVRQKMKSIHALDSDINPYGGVDKKEFFPVISEYFFERPKLLKIKHPELYSQLNTVFTVDLAKKYKGEKSKSMPGRNEKCPCQSGKKYKHCCGKQNI